MAFNGAARSVIFAKLFELFQGRSKRPTRYQHDKVSTEAEIDRLLEEVIALV